MHHNPLNSTTVYVDLVKRHKSGERTKTIIIPSFGRERGVFYCLLRIIRKRRT